MINEFYCKRRFRFRTIGLRRSFLMLRFGRPHSHPSDVYCVRACQVDAGADLLAVGGELFVEILRQVSCDMP